ncbi:MAG: Ig-like domain-containing protein [Coriobacteriales bacterium]|jgi:hypothetical protein|nr:Ig-like domain-containing protein [Coriobacteriales bacterium]
MRRPNGRRRTLLRSLFLVGLAGVLLFAQPALIAMARLAPMEQGGGAGDGGGGGEGGGGDGGGEGGGSGEGGGEGGGSGEGDGSGEGGGSGDGGEGGEGGGSGEGGGEGGGSGEGGGGGGGEGGGSGDGGEGGSGEEGDDTREYVTQLLLRMDEPDEAGERHYVGESWDSAYLQLSINQKGKTVQLNGYYLTNRSDGAMLETANSANPLGVVELSWASSDDAIATVSPGGLITPCANGTVTITATCSDSADWQDAEAPAPFKSVTLIIDGQEGEYVSAVEIIDEAGKPLGSRVDEVTEFNEANFFFQFHAIVTWTDAESNQTRTEDTRFGGSAAISSTITWAIGGSTVPATINEETGRLKTTSYSGNAYVICTVTGGLSGAAVSDRARIQVDTGVSRYDPANSLTLRVVYEMLPDVVAQEHTYSYEELVARLPMSTYNYTLISGSRFGCIRGTGFLLKDVVALEGVDLNDVHRFLCLTSDDYYNPVSYDYLYAGPRYYFPNWDIGSKAEASVVPPMLACANNSEWGVSEIDPTLPMSEGDRFRLLFGPLWAGDANSPYQIFYINAITIELNGAPPVDDGEGDGPGGGGGDDKGPGGGGGGREGEVGGGTSGSGSSGAEGREGAGAEAQSGEEGLSTPLIDMLGVGAAGTLAESNGAPRGWRVYEMMINQNSIVDALDINNPLAPFAVPVALGSVVAGIAYTYVGFRRRLGPPRDPAI